jgi:hypothetical protein
MAAVPPLTLPAEVPAPPATPFGEILFSLAAGLALAFAVAQAVMNYRAAHGKDADLPAGFAPGAVVFALTYGLNRVLLASGVWPAVIADLLLAAVISVPRIRSILRHRKKAAAHGGAKAGLHAARSAAGKAAAALSPAQRQLNIEILALLNMLKIDPKNTFCHEKLSELYERSGRLDLALGAARSAAAQDPTVANRCRVEELEEKAGGKKAG